jgi:1-aminocyclopropane-1-carboxylate deaminase/D-cysteine desulfhydrase-like pyridoxal-dependent ACC family enzyme
MHDAALAAAAEVTFTVTNSKVGAYDVVVVNHGSAGTAGAYVVGVSTIASGSFKITVGNTSTGSLGEAIVLHFAVIGGANS